MTRPDIEAARELNDAFVEVARAMSAYTSRLAAALEAVTFPRTYSVTTDANEEASRIVWRLAEVVPSWEVDGPGPRMACPFCRTPLNDEDRRPQPNVHLPGCLWRRAHEWVTHHPEAST